MTDVSALIEKLEKATGPSRELDAEISGAIGRPAWQDADEDEWMCQYGDTAADIEVARYSSSIDAALTLVPEGWGYLVGHMGINQATLAHVKTSRIVSCFDGVADKLKPATPAIALCIAALRARHKEG